MSICLHGGSGGRVIYSSFPILLSPPEGATVSPTPTFKLKATDPDGNQVKFRVEAKQGGITKVFEIPFVASGAEATYTVPSNQALIDGQWTWRAKAIDQRDAESNWRETRSFTVRRPTIAVNPTSLSFKVSQRAEPISQTFRLTNEGNSAFIWTVTRNENWLTLKPTSGIWGIGPSVNITVTVNPSGLSPQTYETL